MMQVIIRLSQDKGVVDDVGSMNTATRVQGVTDDLVYHPNNIVMPKVGTLHGQISPMENVMLETYPPPHAPILFGGMYTYPYIHFPIIPSPSVT